MTHTAVPLLVGLTVPDARALGQEAGVVVTSRDIDGPPLGALTWPGTWVVTAQEPAAGTPVRRGAVVMVDFEQVPDPQT
ncbi:PASTA domain-containing protein [Actinosynnema sp. NPDC053489]|uniref:PASTA domain-containing protein n=1 Tax=Actinosynnema sp. NPDC053489 TaxID=3363916 RepID=UPI0037C5EE38